MCICVYMHVCDWVSECVSAWDLWQSDGPFPVLWLKWRMGLSNHDVFVEHTQKMLQSVKRRGMVVMHIRQRNNTAASCRCWIFFVPVQIDYLCLSLMSIWHSLPFTGDFVGRLLDLCCCIVIFCGVPSTLSSSLNYSVPEVVRRKPFSPWCEWMHSLTHSLYLAQLNRCAPQKIVTIESMHPYNAQLENVSKGIRRGTNTYTLRGRERERCTPSRAQIVFTNKNKHEHKPKHAGSSDWGLVALSHIFAYFCTLTFFCSYCLSFVIFPHFCDSQPPTNLQCFHVSYFSASLRQLIQLIFVFKFAMFFLEFFAFLKLHFYPHLLS